MMPEFSLFFFSADSTGRHDDKYRLLLESAALADRHGFSAVWTPERHFQRFGGLYPSPSVTGAALAVATKRLSIRAGSVVLPLQNPLRVAEEWSMIDNLSHGRAGISVASGWVVNDFVLAPGTYENRRADMFEKIATIQKLWRGETIVLPNGAGTPTEVRIFPLPVQPEIPIWLTGKSEDTCTSAGRLGLNLLTSNFSLKHDAKEFERRAAIYRETIREHHGRPGHVTLMAHAFVADSADTIEKMVRPAMTEYIDINIDLQQGHDAGRRNEQGFTRLTDRARQMMLRIEVDKTLRGPLSFIGTLDQCAEQATRLKARGVDEIACLIDCGIGFDDAMGSLQRLAALADGR